MTKYNLQYLHLPLLFVDLTSSSTCLQSSWITWFNLPIPPQHFPSIVRQGPFDHTKHSLPFPTRLKFININITWFKILWPRLPFAWASLILQGLVDAHFCSNIYLVVSLIDNALSGGIGYTETLRAFCIIDIVFVDPCPSLIHNLANVVWLSASLIKNCDVQTDITLVVVDWRYKVWLCFKRKFADKYRIYRPYMKKKETQFSSIQRVAAIKQ